MTRQSQTVQIIAAIAALSVGLLVYLLYRQPESVYFIPDWLSLSHNSSSASGNLTDYLPTFIHVYSFILLTVAVAGTTKHSIPICLGWLIVDSLFEIAQINSIANWIGNHTPNWFSAIPVLENTSGYFMAGTFDFFDLISIVIGTIAAYFTIELSKRIKEITKES